MLKNMIVLLLFTVILACNGSGNEGLVGADRDSHGCIGSAGYSWCEKLVSCERPWELAKRYGFKNTKKDLDDFCSKKFK